MARRPTIKDVAALAGVSQGTVSRAMNGDVSVSPELRQRIEDAARSIGYSTNFAARALRGGATKTVSCHLTDLMNPLMTQLYQAIEVHLESAGYTMIVHGTQYSETRRLAALRADIARSVDGLITIGGSTLHKDYEEALTRFSAPVVGIDRASDAYSTVNVDHLTGTAHLVSQLVGLGYRRIGLLIPPVDLLAPRMRLQGMRNALERAGVPFDPLLVKEIPPNQVSPETIASWLGSDIKPDALIVLSVRMLADTLTALQWMGWKPGVDIAIASIGKSRLAELVKPEVTVLRWDLKALGVAAAEMLMAQIETSPGARVIEHMSFPTELILRGSCPAMHGKEETCIL